MANETDGNDPVDVIGERCGNCKFGQGVPQNLQFVECFGLPPSPTFLGVSPAPPPHPPGSLQTRVENLRPQLPRITRGCSLWKDKHGSIPILGSRA